jgi:hypothetical protein
MQLLRSQRVEVTLEQASLPSQPCPAPSPPTLSRAQRAHSRLSWQERLARYARANREPAYHHALRHPRCLRCLPRPLGGVASRCYSPRKGLSDRRGRPLRIFAVGCPGYRRRPVGMPVVGQENLRLRARGRGTKGRAGGGRCVCTNRVQPAPARMSMKTTSPVTSAFLPSWRTHRRISPDKVPHFPELRDRGTRGRRSSRRFGHQWHS